MLGGYKNQMAYFYTGTLFLSLCKQSHEDSTGSFCALAICLTLTSIGHIRTQQGTIKTDLSN